MNDLVIVIVETAISDRKQGLTCTAYNTSKSAVQQMCRSLAQEWGQYGIRVNTLSPGVRRNTSLLHCQILTQILVHQNRHDEPTPGGRTGGGEDMDGRRTTWKACDSRRIQSTSSFPFVGRKFFHDGSGLAGGWRSLCLCVKWGFHRHNDQLQWG